MKTIPFLIASLVVATACSGRLDGVREDGDAGADGAADVGTDGGADARVDGGCVGAGACAIGFTFDEATCSCVALDSGSASCFIPGFGECARNTECVVGHCADGSPEVCMCGSDGALSCASCAAPPPIEAGTD